MKPRLVLAVLFLACWPITARAEHAKIELQIFHYDPLTGKIKTQGDAAVDVEPPPGGYTARPLVKVKAKEPLALQFFFTNTYPHGDIKDAMVRFYVAREEKAGQKTLPDLTKEVVTQGRFKLTFKPKGRVGARVMFTIKTPGIYLLRVQSENTQSDHEHFSAIDLQVE